MVQMAGGLKGPGFNPQPKNNNWFWRVNSIGSITTFGLGDHVPTPFTKRKMYTLPGEGTIYFINCFKIVT